MADWKPTAHLKQAALARAQPLTASLELTYRCNWRCVFCYNPRHHDRRGLTVPEWLGVLDDLRALGTLYVALTGGEPLAHPEFFTIARAARERAFALRILSNAALITDRVAGQIADLRPLAVESSLHGARAETHDRATATPGSFDALLRGVDRLRERGVSMVLKTPLTHLNENEIEEMQALVEGLGIPWRVDPLLTPRDDGDPGPLAYRASARAIESLYRRLAAADRLPHAERSSGGVNCGLGRITIAVDPEGEVYPCIQWRKASLGNVRGTPLRELWATSSTRTEVAAVARAANDRLLEDGGASSRFPFCPALAQQFTGDPLRLGDPQRQQATIADRVRRSRKAARSGQGSMENELD